MYKPVLPIDLNISFIAHLPFGLQDGWVSQARLGANRIDMASDPFMISGNPTQNSSWQGGKNGTPEAPVFLDEPRQFSLGDGYSIIRQLVPPAVPFLTNGDTTKPWLEV
jgi:hypothetical protein